MGLHSEAKLDQKYVAFVKLLNLYLNHFPKSERYGLALEIRRAAYDVYALIVECQKRYHKKTTLTQLDIRHEQLRMLTRLAHELGYFGFKDGTHDTDKSRGEHRYLTLSRLIDELGRMIGGWLLADRAKEEKHAEKLAGREAS
ncbi:MAG: four helix bundle protein [Zymomonas sp.]|nr:four helix bundle protein [Zymomonas sp.]